MRRRALLLLLAASFALLPATPAAAESTGCTVIVATPYAGVDYPGTAGSCTGTIDAGSHQVILHWLRGSTGYAAAYAGTREAPVFLVECGVLLGVPLACNAFGAIGVISFTVVGNGSADNGVLVEVSFLNNDTLTLEVHPLSVGGSTPWVGVAAGLFNVLPS